MTITKSIKLNNEVKAGIDLDTLPDHAKAIQLGIEALKEVDALRKVLTGLGKSLLPGETEED